MIDFKLRELRRKVESEPDNIALKKRLYDFEVRCLLKPKLKAMSYCFTLEKRKNALEHARLIIHNKKTIEAEIILGFIRKKDDKYIARKLDHSSYYEYVAEVEGLDGAEWIRTSGGLLSHPDMTNKECASLTRGQLLNLRINEEWSQTDPPDGMIGRSGTMFCDRVSNFAKRKKEAFDSKREAISYLADGFGDWLKENKDCLPKTVVLYKEYDPDILEWE